MDTQALLEKAEAYIKNLFASYYTDKLLYHNLMHTQRVVAHVKELADHYKLSMHSTFTVVAAAWFHDTGQLVGDMATHEERGVIFMEDFFSNNNIDAATRSAIAQLIMATKMPVSPNTQLEKIICDADTWHLGTMEFHRLDTLVWSELALRQNKPIENQIEKSLQFLQSHKFYTDYCIQKLSAGKQKNIELLKTLLTE